MPQHLPTALFLAALGSSIFASTNDMAIRSAPDGDRSAPSSPLARDDGARSPLDGATLGTPLVVKVHLRSEGEVGSADASAETMPALPTIDWQRIGERLDSAAASGKVLPLAFLIHGDDSSNPLEIAVASRTDTLEWGATAEEHHATEDRYVVALERVLDELLDTATERFPGRPLSIVGLPLEGVVSTDDVATTMLKRITSRLDVLVSDRTFLQVDESVPLATLRSALPSVVAQADRRPVFYRTLQGWASWQPAVAVGGRASDRRAPDDDSNQASEVAPPQTDAGDLAIAEPSWGDPGRDANPSRERPWTAARPVAGRDTPGRASRVDASSSDLEEVFDESPPSEFSSYGAMDFEDEPWLSNGATGVEGSPNSGPDRSRQGPGEPAAIATPERRGSSGNSVTIPTVNTSPTLFPLLGPMGIDSDRTASLSELLSRLAGSQGSPTGDRSSSSRGSTSIGSGTTTGGGGGGASFSTSRGGGAGGTSFGGGGGSSAGGGGSSGGGGGGGITGAPPARPSSSPAPAGTTPPAESPTGPASATSGASTESGGADASANSSSVDVGSPLDTPTPAPPASNGQSNAPAPTIIIPIDSPESPPSNPQSPANDDNPPSADVPDPSTWNPSSGVAPTTPIGSTGDASSSPADEAGSPYQFGRRIDAPIWGYWACDPFRTSDGRLWIGVSAYAVEGIDSVRFLVTGLGATSVSEVDYHPDRSLDAYWIDIRPDDVTGSQVAVTAIVNPSGVADPLESPPLVVEKRNGVWDVPAFDDGWTVLTPSPDSRLVYVATDGNDAEAENNQHGRRYYLPSDPEIGGNPQLPAQPQNIKAYKTISRAVVPIRGTRWRSETNNQDDYGGLWGRPDDPNAHHPDWLLFRRGQTFPHENYEQTIGGPYIDASTDNIIKVLVQHGTGEQVGGSRKGFWGGRSDSERAVITAWGTSYAEPRPILHDQLQIDDVPGNIAITSVETRVSFWTPAEQMEGSRNILIEDCTGVGGGTNRAWWSNVIIRRCTTVDAFSTSGHVQGMFIATPDTTQSNVNYPPTFVIEECVFDRNGYKEDPNEPTTWTRSVVFDLGLSGYGTGYQPKRTYYDRNIYGAIYDSLLLRGNIVARGGGGGSVQMRSGGVAERNLFMWNPSHLAIGAGESFEAYWNSSLVKDNCFLHFDNFLPFGAHDSGIGIAATVFPVVIADNVIAKSRRTTGNYGMIRVLAKPESHKSPASPADTVIVVNNDIHVDGGKTVMQIADTGDIRTLVVRDNAVYLGDQKDTNPNWHFAALMESNWSNAQGITGEPWDIGGNDYFSDASEYGFRFQRIDKTQPYDLSAWQAAGFDIGSTVHTSKAALSSAAGWTDPDRSILTYMQAVDPTYVVDEDVYVDEDTTGQKQANRVEVWRALSSEDQTDPHANGTGLTTAESKQVAREYHAFISFIQKARANRKGAWDSRWTADAVNNYMREGFGKPPVAWGRD